MSFKELKGVRRSYRFAKKLKDISFEYTQFLFLHLILEVQLFAFAHQLCSLQFFNPSRVDELHRVILQLLSINPLGLLVCVQRADVEAASGHGPGVHGGVVDHIVSEVAWGILATAVVDAV